MEHNPSSPSQDPVERALQDIREEPVELRPEIKVLHKQQLLSLAERVQGETRESVKVMEPTSTVKPRRSVWQHLRLIVGGAGAGFALAMCALVLFMNVRNGGLNGEGSIDSLGRILIPAAHATDAFQVYADAETPKIAAKSALILESKVALSSDQVKRVLQVDTGRIEQVERVSPGTFRVQLAAVPSNAVVRVALATAVQADSSTDAPVNREYSWAVQTTDKLELVSSLPANNAGDVPLDASLELTLNAQGFMNVTSSVEITPAIEGTFQVNGRRIVFVPSKPWQPSTLYSVRLKQGLSAENLALPQDVLLQFQTGDGTTNSQNVPSLRVFGEFQEIYVGDTASIQLSRSPDLAKGTSTVSVTGYRLTEDEAVQFLAKRLPYSYSFGSADNLVQYRDFAKTEVFKADLALSRPSERDSELVTLPKFTEQGWYLIRVAAGSIEAWSFIQVTNVATYTVADKDQVVVWVVNAETKQALTSYPVRLDGGEARLTDASGVVHLPTPAFLNATTSAEGPAVALLRLGDVTGSLRTLVALGPTLNVNPFDRFARAQERTWGYAYPDRPLYRTSDEMQVAGILQDRDHTSPIGQAELRLTKASYGDHFLNGQDPIYASTPLTLDAAGRYEATLSWKNVLPGYYQLDLIRDGELVISRFVEIRTFAKPAYYVDVSLSAKRLLAGQEAQARIQANFFSGAALPNARLRVRVSQGDVTLPDQEVTLDTQGHLDLPVKTLPVLCSGRLADTCRNVEQLQIMVYPVEGEEAQILGTAMLDVVGSELDVRGEVKESENKVELALQTYHRDLNKELDELGTPWSGRTLHGQIVGIRYEKIQDGVWYDAIEKKVSPYYRYEQRQDPPIEFTLTTDGAGRVTYNFPLRADRDFYEVTIQGEDVSARSTRFTTSVAHSWYQPNGVDVAPRLVLEGKGEERDVHVGEILKPTLQLGTSTVDVSQGPGVLFLTMSRGIKQAIRTSSASWQTTFDASLIPNATLRAVTFNGKRFYSADAVVFLAKEDRTLDVQVTTDKTTYQPGEKAKLRFQVQTNAGQSPATDVKIAYAVVDESLLSLSDASEEDPLQWINNYVSNGLLFERTSHVGDWLLNNGGSEKGGGGSGDRNPGTRKLFKDVAGTGFVALSADGSETAEVTLPDNLTSWRITAVALGSDLRAGVAKQSIQVSKQVFVDAVIPERVLGSDAPVIKLRAFGSGLQMNQALTFTVSAPSLGLANYSATGTAGQAIYIAVPKLVAGSHVLTVSVTQGAVTDRLERTLQVVTTRVARQEIVTLDPTPGMGVTDLNTETTELIVNARGRSSLYNSLQNLASSESLRSDARLAAAAADELLQAYYQQAPKDTTNESLIDIQTSDEGGIHLLPYGSAEVPLTMQVALTKPDAVDTWQLRAYLSEKLISGKTRLERLQAMAGLAALRASVVLDLQQASTLTDRTPEESLVIIEGLVAVGDIERAGQLMRELLAKSVLRDGQRFVQIGTESSAETYEATAEATALAERLLLPQVKQLNAFVENNWSQEAFPVLAKVRYLDFRLQHLPAQEGSLQWTDGQRTETIQLKDTPFKTIVLSPEQLRSFRVLAVSGAVDLSYLRTVSGLPVKSPTLSLTRRYEAAKPLNELVEGDELTITLSPRFEAAALNGCALVRDDLSANVLPLSQSTIGNPEPLFLRSNTVSFLTCKNDQVRDFSYRVKVMARGTYRAEPAIMQRLDTPSVATYTEEQGMTVR